MPSPPRRARADRPLAKLLSHRLRGFAPREHDPRAFAALRSIPVPYVEVDVRGSVDHIFVLSHDAHAQDADGRRQRIASVPAAGLRIQGAAATTLDEAFRRFKECTTPDQRICVDIKDFGHEQDLLDLIGRHRIEHRTVLISWIPQTLTALAELGASSPLFLSYLDLAALGWPGQALARILAGSLRRIGPFVLIGGGRAHDPLGALGQGYQHALITCGLDDHLQAVLADSRGGICLPTWLARPAVTAMAQNRGLRIAVFNTRTADDFRHWSSREDVDIVFSDDAPTVFRELS